MLHEDQRFVKPEDVAKQVPWDQMEYVIIIAQPKAKTVPEDATQLWMSTLTVDELAFAVQQLQAHTTVVFGPMVQMPNGK